MRSMEPPLSQETGKSVQDNTLLSVKTQENLLLHVKASHNFSCKHIQLREAGPTSQRKKKRKERKLKQFNREMGKRIKQILQKRYPSSHKTFEKDAEPHYLLGKWKWKTTWEKVVLIQKSWASLYHSNPLQIAVVNSGKTVFWKALGNDQKQAENAATLARGVRPWGSGLHFKSSWKPQKGNPKICM